MPHTERLLSSFVSLRQNKQSSFLKNIKKGISAIRKRQTFIIMQFSMNNFFIQSLSLSLVAI
jgi:hypothetical protein